MGSKCSALRRGTVEEDCRTETKRKNESSTTENEVKPLLFQRTPSVQEEGGAERQRRETLEGIEEETYTETNNSSEKKSPLAQQCTVAEVSTLGPCHSKTHDTETGNKEDKEADWVDKNRTNLIQSVTLVMPIVDEMLEHGIIHKESYANIQAARTTQEQMRQVYKVLTTSKAKSIFWKILHEIQPEIDQTEDVIKQVIEKHKAHLRKKFQKEFEGTEKDRKNAKSLYKIYTQLHIVRGEREHVNNEHEIWEIEDKTRTQTAESTKINLNDIFRSNPEDTHQEESAIRTVMTKGIAGIGKTVSVKKFILDWADGKANQDLDFIFVLPFRELNLVLGQQFSLEALVKDFHPELKKIGVSKLLEDYKVLFIFDGLDESQLRLDFKKATRLTNVTREASVDTLVTNLIREDLLPSAHVWITSRPGAVRRIPRQFVYQWTEVRGFNDPQKIEYFKKRVEDEASAERIIKHITMSRSLYIMCHIPIFCWIAAKVFEYLLPKMCNTQRESINIPTTLTEMYTHFLVIQMQVATEKYGSDSGIESDTEEIFKSNKDFIWRLGRMAYEQLDRGNIIFTKNVLEEYGIDLEQAGVNCGLCTEIFKEEESVFASEKHYCFVHLTVQEYFAALFVYRSFTIKNINSQNLKDFLLKGSEEELQSELEKNPLELPLDELLEITIANSTIRKTGELDMFLRFLSGMSLQSTQKLLRGLIKQTENHSGVIESIKTSLLEMDLTDCSPERCLNLVHCLIELKDGSLHGTVQQYLRPDHSPDTQLSPVQCSALADLILMSSTPLDEFDLMKYKPSSKGIFRLIPAVRNCRKARISGVNLNNWLCEAIASALQMPNSVLTELHLTNNDFSNDLKPLTESLRNSQCTLEALSLSGSQLTDAGCDTWGSAIKSLLSNLTELELSNNVLRSSLCSVLSDVLSGPKLERLRLNRNANIATVCEKMVVALTSQTCCLRELQLNHTNFKDSEMEILSTGLMSTTCTLEILSVSHNKLTEKCCETLASVLSSKTSKLRNLDLSYNDLHDTGVRMLCSGLKQSNCALKTLRLSFCKVTADGCAALASAVRSDHCGLRELDLSFNHLTDQGVQKLTELQRDSHCSLEKLNVDYNDRCWFDLQLLRQYACDLTLDPNTVGKNIILAEHHKKAERVEEKQQYPDHPERFLRYQVLCKEGLSGRHYWEVECVLADVGVAYKSMDRTGDCSVDYSFGRNEKSWCWCCRGEFYHNNSCEEFGYGSYPTTMGVYLDWPAGILSFFEVFAQKLTHLHTVHTTFTEPLYPGFCLDGTGTVSLCKIN